MHWRELDGETDAPWATAKVALLFLLATLAQTAWTTDAPQTSPAQARNADGIDAVDDAQAENAAPKTAAPTAAQGDPADLDVETILSNPLDDEAYRQRRSCVHTRVIDRVEILDDTMVLFHVRRNKAWLNQLSSRCLGLERDMIVNLRIFGGSICRLDTFRGLTRMGGSPMPSAHCRLGDFEAIEGPQIDALRTALEERRKAAALERKTRRTERRERRRERRQGQQ